MRNISFACLLLSLLVFSCEGDPSIGGDADLCYATIAVRAAPVGQLSTCSLGGELGFDLRFEDESGAVYEFNNQIIENANSFNDGIFIALPVGHEYDAWILNNGYQNNCVALDVNFTIQITPTDVCTSIGSTIDERLEICCGTPDANFELNAPCDGCVPIAQYN